MTDIAHGEIKIDLNDEDVIAGLRKVDAQFDRTMSRIDREEAVAKIEADLAPLSDKVEKAKRKIRELQGKKAEVRVDGNTKELTRKIKLAERELKRLDGRKATLEIELKGAEKALAAEAALEAADHKRAVAAEQTAKRIEASQRQEQQARERASRENMARVNSDARVMQSLERQRVSEMRTAEAQAHRMDAAFQKAAYERDVGSRKELTRIIELQKQYARLTDKLEYLDKKKPIGREARAKVELDATGVVAKMELLKAELNALGAHPPVDIKADVNQKGLKRITQGFGNFLTGLANKASGLQDLSVRLGPFTTSLRGLGLALGFLGPTITDLLGAAGSLVGVLGAGVAGAATLGSGAITGLAGDFLGLKFATRNTGQELTIARSAINSYQKAVLQYGKGSDQAVAKQKQMNSVLKQVSPLAREAALGTEKFFTAWDKSTQPTQRSLGTIAKQGFQALNSLRPMWAASTNEMAGQLQKSLGGAFKFLERDSTHSLIGGILHDFNAQLPTILHGLGSLGQAFLNISAQGAANFGSLAHGFDHLATSILNFTQQDSFGATVRRWVTYAGDIMRFFGAAGRVLVHFFGDGSKAGDNFINTMTNAMNRWDRFIQSADGKNKIGEFFQNSVNGAEALYSAFKPIVQLFALWSVGLEPAVTVITQIFAGITNAAAALGKFVGLGNPLKTMGATFGALFAVSKIGAFVSMLARASAILNDMRKAEAGGGLLGMLRGIGNGSFLQQLGSGRGIAAAGTAAAGEMRSAIIAGGTVAAGEMRAAIAEGGAVAATEEAAGAAGGAGGGLVGAAKKLILPAGAAAEVSGVGAAAGTAAAETGALATGVAALGGIGATVATGGLALLIGGLAVAIIHFSHNRSEVDKLTDRLNAANDAMKNDATWANRNAAAQNNAAKAHGRAKDTIASLSKQLDQATPGTMKYRNLQLKLYDAHQQLAKATDALTGSAQKQHDNAKSEVQDGQKQLDLIKQRTAARLKEKGLTLDDIKNTPGANLTPGVLAANLAARNKILSEGADQATAAQHRLTAALNDQATATLNVKRAAEGLGAVTGKSAQQLGALARIPKAKPLAQTIALKYQNPTNAGNVAAAAKAALGSGIKLKTVMQIVADSKNAEQAIRRLTSMRIAKKMLQLGISGDGGVLSKLNAIDRKAIRQKIAHIIEQGGNPTMDKIMSIIRTQIRDKKFSIAAIDEASAHIYSVLAAENGLHDKTVTLTTNEVHNIVTRMKNYPHARGLGAGEMGTHSALIGEGGAPEWRYNTKTGMAYKTSGPQFTTLDAHDAIIPTEPKYRARGREIVRSIADDLGIAMYAGSKHPKKPAHHKGHTKHTLPAARTYLRLSPDEYQARYDTAKQKYDNVKSNKKASSKQKAAARHALNVAREENRHAKAFADKIAGEQQEAGIQLTKMGTADAQGNDAAYNSAKGSRMNSLRAARKNLQYELRVAKGAKWRRDIRQALAEVTSSIQDTSTSEPSAPDAATTFTKSEQQTLDRLNANIALAALTDDGNADDIATEGALANFLSGILGGITGGDPASRARLAARGGPGAITEIAGALKQANDTIKGFSDTSTGTSPDAQSQLDQANQRARIAEVSLITTGAALDAYRSSGDIGSGYRDAGSAAVYGATQASSASGGGGYSPPQWTTASGAPASDPRAAQGGPTININTLHPGDPATLAAVANAATAGIGYQGSTTSPRTSVGY